MRYRRNFQPGGTYFFTLVTFRRQPLFEDEAAIELLQDMVREVKANRPFRMEAWVVLHDHLHMIWTLPPEDTNYPRRWAAIKANFTREWLARGGTEAAVSEGKKRDERRGVWQPRYFEHTMRDEEDFERHVEYVHFNPVKHGYVDYPKQWRHSSFHEYVRRGIYPKDWCCGGGDGDADDKTLWELPYKGYE